MDLIFSCKWLIVLDECLGDCPVASNPQPRLKPGSSS